MKVVNAYSISPSDIETDDIMLFVIKAMVVAPSRYRIYRCLYPPRDLGEGGIPQGSRVSNEREVCEAFFPSLAQVAEPD